MITKRNGEFVFQSESIYHMIALEIIKAGEKHGDGVPATRHSFLSILAEEIGEIAKSINKQESPDELRKEIIQVIAVCQMYLEGILRDSPK